MSLANFIPQVWSGSMLRYLDKVHVFGQSDVVNRDYEGEISAYGDTVKINQVGPITLGSYTKDTDISAAQTLIASQTNLVIDTAKYFNFEVDDVDKAQDNPKVMETAMERAAYAVSDESDLAIATAMAAAAGNSVTVATLGTVANAYIAITQAGQKLSENNVPRNANRWLVVPPWFTAILLQDTTRFATGYSDKGEEYLATGYVGRAAGFNIYESNNLSATNGSAQNSVCTMLAGVNWACTFAEQIVEVEAYRPQLRFADAVKGLHVYGVKVVLPNALCTLAATVP
jgi:hypothetical protein